MLRLKIHDAAGPTTGFWYETGDWSSVSNSASLIAIRSTILSGPLAGRRILQKMYGDFDTESGDTSQLDRLKMIVDGEVHLSARFDEGFRNTGGQWERAFESGIAMIGNRYANQLGAGEGDDVLIGDDGRDTIEGYNGDDYLDGGRGADIMTGGRGNDTYVIDDRRDQAWETPTDGIDTVISSVSYMLTEGFENLLLDGARAVRGRGNVLDNRIEGDSADNRLKGYEGDDRLYGGSGRDRLHGGPGADRLDGGKGADRMFGDIGDDTYLVDDARDRILEPEGGGADLVRAKVGFDLPRHVDNLTLTGGKAIDGGGNGLGNQILGNRAANALQGGKGSDLLNGRGGDDELRGGSDFDIILGGSGADEIIGGRGFDLLTGGAGSDTFVYENIRESVDYMFSDRIEDFRSGEDTVDLSDIDANLLTAGDDPFRFIGTASFSGSAGELRYENGSLSGDVDGFAGGDFDIAIANFEALLAGDFIL
jgi:Ca2+-binding RTX toxin-like protein